MHPHNQRKNVSIATWNIVLLHNLESYCSNYDLTTTTKKSNYHTHYFLHFSAAITTNVQKICFHISLFKKNIKKSPKHNHCEIKFSP